MGYGSAPHNCDLCQLAFREDFLLQAKVKHLALTEGEGVARSELDEALASEHEEHFPRKESV